MHGEVEDHHVAPVRVAKVKATKMALKLVKADLQDLHAAIDQGVVVVDTEEVAGT